MPSRALPAAFAAWRWGIPATAVWAGYRVYYVHRGAEIVILLCGGNKRTQQQDIKKALRVAETL